MDTSLVLVVNYLSQFLMFNSGIASTLRDAILTLSFEQATL
jgi:hypothetical protein